MRRTGGIGRTSAGGRIGFLALVTAAWLLGLVPGAGAEIIYAHGRPPGEELIAMNDDGSGAHVLLTPEQVPGPPTIINLAAPNVLADGTTLAFAGETGENIQLAGPPSDCGTHCEGIYTLANGKITRLSEQPVDTPSGSSAEGDPAVTADGRVVYQTLGFTWPICAPRCEVAIAFSEAFDVRPLAGGAPQEWLRLEPKSVIFGLAADPADGGEIAYAISASPNLLEVADQEGVAMATIQTPHGSSPAFSPDGSQLAYIDRELTDEGSGAGVDVVAASTGAQPHEVLADPSPPSSPFSTPTFGGITWVGSSELAFTADVSGARNLYSLPAHCLTGQPCTLGEATKLTSDATETAPDSYPTWTSATIAGPGGIGSAPAPTPTGASTPTAGKSSFAHANTKGHTASLTITCVGAAGSTCADSLALSAIETLRSGKLVAVAAKTKKRTVTLGTASVTLSGGQSRTMTVSLNATGRRLFARRRSLAVKLTVKQDIGGKSVVVKTLVVTFVAPKRSSSHR